jgi:uncharacterized membrane protein
MPFNRRYALGRTTGEDRCTRRGNLAGGAGDGVVISGLVLGLITCIQHGIMGVLLRAKQAGKVGKDVAAALKLRLETIWSK